MPLLSRSRTAFALALATAGLVVSAVPASAFEGVLDVQAQWLHQFGSTAGEEALALSAIPSGDVYVGGYTGGTLGEADTNPSSDDGFVAKYDKKGNRTWAHLVGTTGNSRVTGVAGTRGGDVYVVGFTDGTLVTGESNHGGLDGFVAKYDKKGNRKWAHLLGTGADDGAAGVAVTPAGDVYVVGYTDGTLAPGETKPGGTDGFVAKYDKKGNHGWTRYLGTTEPDSLTGVSVTRRGAIYVSGRTSGAFEGQTALGAQDGLVARLDRDGRATWIRVLSSAVSDDTIGIAATDSGDVFVGGTTYGSLNEPNAGGGDGYVARFDATGTRLWLHQFGTSREENSRSLTASSSGDVYVAGFTRGSLGSPLHVKYDDAFITKFSRVGNRQWIHQFGTVNIDTANAVSATPSGDLYAAGSTSSLSIGSDPPLGAQDAFLARFPVSATDTWFHQQGSPADEYSDAVARAANGDVYVGGSTMGDLVSTNAGGRDAVISRYDRNGTLLWSRQFGTTENDEITSVAVTRRGDVYVSGYTLGTLSGTSAGKDDAFIAKYDKNGNQKWIRQYGTTGSDDAWTIAVTPSGDVYVSGNTSGSLAGTNPVPDSDDVYVAKYDRNGNRKWIHQFGTPADDDVFGIAVTPRGDTYLAGTTLGDLAATNPGNGDAFLAKYDRNGTQKWIRQVGTVAEDDGNAVAVLPDGGAYLVGDTAGDVAGTNRGLYDGFVARYDRNGTQKWARQFGTDQDDWVSSVGVSSSGTVYLGGSTAGALDGENNKGNDDAMLAAYSSSGTALWAHQFGTAGADLITGLAMVSASSFYATGVIAGSLNEPNVGGNDLFVAKLVV